MSLTRDDWTEAGLAALAQHGLRGVAVEPLAKHLGATRGSFYWHFADRDELIAATLELWELRETTQVIERINAPGDAREKLAALGRYAFEAAAAKSAHAAVLAAADHVAVAPVLARVTQTRLGFLRQQLADLGLDAQAVEAHAHLAYAMYLGVGELRRTLAAVSPQDASMQPILDLAIDTVLATIDQAAHTSPNRVG